MAASPAHTDCRSQDDAFGVLAHWPRIAPRDRAALRDILWWDLTSEYDARFLTHYLASLELDFSAPFRAAWRRWDTDEERHYEGFFAVNRALFDRGEDVVRGRRPHFAPLAHLFTDEFRICCLMVYDELATVRGYRVNLPLYDQLGHRLGAFVRRVIAEEGMHYGGFLSVLRTLHTDRLDEVPATVARIRAAEGTPYRATFVMDHDDADIYTTQVADEAERILCRAAGAAMPRRLEARWAPA